MLKKKVEGELAYRIVKLAKNGFPLTSKKVCQTAYKFARENGIKGFSIKYEAVGVQMAKDTETTIKPTSTEEYIESSVSELRREDVPKVLQNKDIREMVLDKTLEQKKKELAKELLIEKKKQEEIRHRW